MSSTSGSSPGTQCASCGQVSDGGYSYRFILAKKTVVDVRSGGVGYAGPYTITSTIEEYRLSDPVPCDLSMCESCLLWAARQAAWYKTAVPLTFGVVGLAVVGVMITFSVPPTAVLVTLAVVAAFLLGSYVPWRRYWHLKQNPLLIGAQLREQDRIAHRGSAAERILQPPTWPEDFWGFVPDNLSPRRFLHRRATQEAGKTDRVALVPFSEDEMRLLASATRPEPSG